MSNNQLLQISRWQSEEHSDREFARFKCLTCYEMFEIYSFDLWSFCPKCGAKIVMVRRDIKQKDHRFYNNAGYSTLIDGKFVHIVPPIFTLIKEYKGLSSEYEWLACSMFPICREHQMLKHYARAEHNCRIRILPSDPLLLP